MSGMNKAKRELFAQLLARGVSPKPASLEVGYSERNPERAELRARHPWVVARVAEIRRELAREAADVSAIVGRMIEAAELAAALNSAPGFVALKGLLTEAARLKRLTAETLPVRPAPAPRPATRPFRVLTDEEWQAKFAHLAHRAP